VTCAIKFNNDNNTGEVTITRGIILTCPERYLFVTCTNDLRIFVAIETHKLCPVTCKKNNSADFSRSFGIFCRADRRLIETKMKLPAFLQESREISKFPFPNECGITLSPCASANPLANERDDTST